MMNANNKMLLDSIYLNNLPEENGSSIKTIAKCLEVGDFVSARTIYINQDTLVNKELEKYLLNIFGCRTHLTKGCDSIFC